MNKNPASEEPKWIRRTASVYKDLLKTLFRLSRDSEIKLIVTSLSFVSILSIVPFIGSCLAIFKIFGGFEPILPKLEAWIFSSVTAGLSERVLEAIISAIDRLNSGALGISGFAFLVITSTKLLSDIEKAVQRIWKVSENRPFWRKVLSYWGIIFLSPLALAFSLGFLSSKWLDLSSWLPARHALPILGFLALFLIYTMSPNRKVHFIASSISALLTGGLFLIAKDLYFYATKNLLMVNEIYGSLASIPIFLIWIQLLWTIFLFGVVLSASIQHVLFDQHGDS